MKGDHDALAGMKWDRRGTAAEDEAAEVSHPRERSQCWRDVGEVLMLSRILAGPIGPRISSDPNNVSVTRERLPAASITSRAS